MKEKALLETILLTDGYKLDHRRQYPKGTEQVYCNFTPRSCNWYPEAHDGIKVKDRCSDTEEQGGMLRTVFIDGETRNKQTLDEIRQRIKKTY